MNKKGLTANFLIFLINIYKSYISPLLPNSCRFHPTCSTYTIEAIEIHGSFKGIWMGLKRIFKCNPLFKGGHDPVEKEQEINR